MRTMLHMPIIAALLFISLLALYGCGQDGSTTIGNGKVDPVEEAALQVAVGAAMAAYPQAIALAYQVSTALLAVLDSGQTASTDTINQAVAAEVDKLNLDQPTKASFIELADLIKLQIIQQLQREQIATDQRVVVVRQLIAVVQRAAAARMGL